MEQYFAVLIKGSTAIAATVLIIGAALTAVMVEILLFKWAIVETWRKLQKSLTTAAYEKMLRKKWKKPAPVPNAPRPAEDSGRPQETLTDNKVRKISNGHRK